MLQATCKVLPTGTEWRIYVKSPFLVCFKWTQILMFSSVQSLSPIWLFLTPWTAGCQASLSTNNSWSLLKLMSVESEMPSNHLILCCPLLLLEILNSIWYNIDTDTDGRALTRIRPAEAWKNIYLLHPLPFLLPHPCLPVDILLLWKFSGFLVERNHFGRQFNDILQIWRYATWDPEIPCLRLFL